VRAAAQHLGAREQEQQRRLPRRSGLDGAPGKIVEPFELTLFGCGERHRAAFVPLAAAGIAMGLRRGRRTESDHDNKNAREHRP